MRRSMEPGPAHRDPAPTCLAALRIRGAIRPGMPMRHTHTKALLPAFPGFAPPPAYRAGTLGPDARRTPAGPPPDAMEPGFHWVRTHWNRGFIAFQLARRTRTVMLMVSV